MMVAAQNGSRAAPLYIIYFVAITFFIPITIIGISWGLISVSLCYQGIQGFT